MFAVYAESFSSDDPLSALRVGERPDPVPDSGWTTIDVKAASLNHHDLWSLRGVGLKEAALPMILGCDAAGLDEDGNEVVVHAVHVSLFSPYGIGATLAATLGRGAGPGDRALAVGRDRRAPAPGRGHRPAPLAGDLVGGQPRRRGQLPALAGRGAGLRAAQRRRRGLLACRCCPAAPAGPGRPGRSGCRGDVVTLVSVMRLMPRKRPLQVLRMFEQVRRLAGTDDVRLVIVGDGPMRARIERRIRRRGLTGHVRVTGRLPRPAVLDELAAASVYVAPAPRESFGIAALEARCAGLPVVASRRSGVGEFIRDRVDGILVAGDTEMVGALADLVRDTELRERIADHNRAVPRPSTGPTSWPARRASTPGPPTSSRSPTPLPSLRPSPCLPPVLSLSPVPSSTTPAPAHAPSPPPGPERGRRAVAARPPRRRGPAHRRVARAAGRRG